MDPSCSGFWLNSAGYRRAPRLVLQLLPGAAAGRDPTLSGRGPAPAVHRRRGAPGRPGVAPALALLSQPEPAPGPYRPVGPRSAGAPVRPGLVFGSGRHPGCRPRPGLDLLPRLARLWASLRAPAAGREWRSRWNRPGKSSLRPGLRGRNGPVGAPQDLLHELAATLGTDPLNAGEFLAWLEHGRTACVCPAPGSGKRPPGPGTPGDAGLEFDRVFCLGMNSGTFPPPPRALPLLTAAERKLVLGAPTAASTNLPGTYMTLCWAAPRTWFSPGRGSLTTKSGVAVPFTGTVGAAGDGGAEPAPPGLAPQSGRPGGLFWPRRGLCRL